MKKPDFSFLKSRKVFVSLVFSLYLLTIVFIKPEAVSQNAGTVQSLIVLVTVVIGAQGAIDHKKEANNGIPKSSS